MTFLLYQRQSRDAVQSIRSLQMFRRNVLHLSSGQKMEETRSSETLINVYRTTRRHIPEDNNLYSPCREDLKSHKVKITQKN
jgi:hypothetical protein